MMEWIQKFSPSSSESSVASTVITSVISLKFVLLHSFGIKLKMNKVHLARTQQLFRNLMQEKTHGSNAWPPAVTEIATESDCFAMLSKSILKSKLPD
jgi:hypothetical protein